MSKPASYYYPQEMRMSLQYPLYSRVDGTEKDAKNIKLEKKPSVIKINHKIPSLFSTSRKILGLTALIIGVAAVIFGCYLCLTPTALPLAYSLIAIGGTDLLVLLTFIIVSVRDWNREKKAVKRSDGDPNNAYSSYVSSSVRGIQAVNGENLTDLPGDRGTVYSSLPGSKKRRPTITGSTYNAPNA